MDPLPDFGLFELLAATGIACVSRQIFSRAWVGYFVLLIGEAAPLAIVFLADTEMVRWIGAAALATALINAGYIFPQLREEMADTSTRQSPEDVPAA